MQKYILKHALVYLILRYGSKSLRIVFRWEINLLPHREMTSISKLIPRTDRLQICKAVIPLHADPIQGLSGLHDVGNRIRRNGYLNGHLLRLL